MIDGDGEDLLGVEHIGIDKDVALPVDLHLVAFVVVVGRQEEGIEVVRQVLGGADAENLLPASFEEIERGGGAAEQLAAVKSLRSVESALTEIGVVIAGEFGHAADDVDAQDIERIETELAEGGAVGVAVELGIAAPFGGAGEAVGAEPAAGEDIVEAIAAAADRGVPGGGAAIAPFRGGAQFRRPFTAPRDDVDDPADRVGPLKRALRPAENFYALDFQRQEAGEIG